MEGDYRCQKTLWKEASPADAVLRDDGLLGDRPTMPATWQLTPEPPLLGLRCPLIPLSCRQFWTFDWSLG